MTFTIADIASLEQLLEDVSLCEAAEREAIAFESEATADGHLGMLIFTNDVLNADVPARTW